MNDQNNLIFIFPSNIVSGHENMAIKIMQRLKGPDTTILTRVKFPEFNSMVYKNFFTFLFNLLLIRLTFKKKYVILVSGSPYGYLKEKLLIKLLFFYLIDYVPMPELIQMEDRLHHKFMPLINKILVNKRILIDSWQIQYSAVKNVSIIKNIV